MEPKNIFHVSPKNSDRFLIKVIYENTVWNLGAGRVLTKII